MMKSITIFHISKRTIFLIFIVLVSLGKSAIVPTSQPTNLPPSLQKLFALISGNDPSQAALLSSPQYSGFIQLLSQIPNDIIDQFVRQLSSGVLEERPSDFNAATNFSNWGETVQADYQTILYPSEFSPLSGKQVSLIQQFVKKAAAQGRRVRGSGLRHSWSNIFADPHQYLVSLYPYFAVQGTSQVLDVYAAKMAELETAMSALNIEHLNQIRKVGEINESKIEGGQAKNVTKHLVKIGASVSNQQLRKWSVKNGVQIKSNVIMVEINFVGALCTCSHGSGKDTQTLCDYVHEIEFIDSNGNRQTISKKDHPQLIRSAAGSLGLLGIVIFVTVQMEDLQIVKMTPRTSYKDFIIPWPKDYPIEKQKARMQRPQYQTWVQSQNSQSINQAQNWANNFNEFVKATNETYCQWIYFPAEGSSVFQNTWNVYSKKTPENIKKVELQSGIFVENYPPENVKSSALLTKFLTNILFKHEQTAPLASTLLRSSFSLLPRSNTFVNYPDAVHFERGINNIQIRDLQCEINIPLLEVKGKIQIDFDLIQKIWWTTMQIVEKTPIINFVVQMRFHKGSDATLASQAGFDYSCSIEILRTSVLSKDTQEIWRRSILQVFESWKSLVDSNGNKVVIRPHWGKEWDSFPSIKQTLIEDEDFENNVRQFLNDYKEIAKLKGFSYKKNLQTFSNKVYRQLLNNVIESEAEKIE